MSFYVSHKNGVTILFRYDRLDELVKSTGKKKKYLSEKMGHSGRYLNDAKKQNTDIKIEEVKILAEELLTSVEYLRGETEIKEKPAQEGELDEETKELRKIWDDSDPDERQALLEMARLIKKKRGK